MDKPIALSRFRCPERRLNNARHAHCHKVNESRHVRVNSVDRVCIQTSEHDDNRYVELNHVCDKTQSVMLRYSLFTDRLPPISNRNCFLLYRRRDYDESHNGDDNDNDNDDDATDTFGNRSNNDVIVGDWIITTHGADDVTS